MDGVKSIFASRTFWGSFIALLAVLANAFGLNVQDADATGVADKATDLVTAISTHNWGAVGTTVLALGGIVYAIYGRMKATKAIK